jgi:hypothetical protein
MDDPWGSPWATTKNPPVTSSEKLNIEAPPPVFISSASASLSIPAGQSPWADDDAFGDWSTAEPQQSPSAWGAWAGSQIGAPDLTPRYEGHRRDVSVAWPGSTSPGQRSLVLAPSLSSSRQPSPDPWSAERYSPTKPLSPLPTLDQFALSPSLGQPLAEIHGEARTGPHVEARDSVTGHTRDAKERGHEGQIPLRESWVDKAAIDSAISTSETMPPRTSSESSDDSGFDEPNRHIPVTSDNDDDGQNLRDVAENERKSSKVRELVHMYDGMARVKVEQKPIALPLPTKALHDGEPTSCSSKGNVDALDEPVIDEELGVQHEESHHKVAPGATESDSILCFEEGLSGDYPLDVRRALAFSIDLSKLDELIPDVHDTVSTVQDDAPVADHIIRDSFTTISERKLWYRIVRLGSSRKHDSGLEDNYSSVTWQGSAVRIETSKIVRRWMEEDSIAGRPVLGAGLGRSSSTHMFGWDSSAAPVELETVFRRRSSMQHMRRDSGSRVLPEGAGSQPTSPRTPRTLATFGWSTNPTGLGSEQGISPPNRSNNPIIDNTAPSPIAHSSAAVEATSAAARVPESQQATVTELDEDDDWGEMVTSPKDNIGQDISLADGNTWAFAPKRQSVLAAKLSTASEPSIQHLSRLMNPSGATLLALRGPMTLGGKQNKKRDTNAIADLVLQPTKSQSRIASHQPISTVRAVANTAPRSSTNENDDIIIKTIVQFLPDLSYMLR